MFISKKRIRKLRAHFKAVQPGTQVVVGARVPENLDGRLQIVGFPPGSKVGDTVLPADIGPVTHFNAEGGQIIHKDQERETAYRQVEWHWTEWHGPYEEEQSRIIDVPYLRYPRTPIPPPSIQLRIALTTSGQRVLVAPPMTFNGVEDVNLIHAINVVLEIFGFCEVFTHNLDEIIKAPIRYLNWRILPAGHRTWEELRPQVEEVIKRAPRGNQVVISHRLETINSYDPDFFAIGQAGFAGYLVFGFTGRHLYVFESIHTGNATYIFDDNWEHLSKLTKTQILNDNLQKARLLHRENWQSNIGKFLRPLPGAPR